MGESRRRKSLGLPPRERVVMSYQERRVIIQNAVKKAISDVQYMYSDMNKTRVSK